MINIEFIFLTQEGLLIAVPTAKTFFLQDLSSIGIQHCIFTWEYVLGVPLSVLMEGNKWFYDMIDRDIWIEFWICNLSKCNLF